MTPSLSITKILIVIITVALIAIGIYFFSPIDKPQEETGDSLPLFEIEGEDAATRTLPRNISVPEEDDAPEGLWD
ncbi:MAG: hypothetical protein Q8R40_05750 [bacterium]|nr:hypothetical protein [bacterium]